MPPRVCAVLAVLAVVTSVLATLLLSASMARAQGLRVTIQSTPPGAMVFLDGATRAEGVTPLSTTLRAGTHVVVLRLAGHVEQGLEIDVTRDGELFPATLVRGASVVLTAQNPPAQGAAIRIDGADAGNVPTTRELQPGRHLVQVGRRGYITYNQWVDLAPGQALQLPVLLRSRGGEMGSLLVAGDVSGARVLVDGVDRGTAPLVVDTLAVGTHRVRVEAPRGSGLGAHDEQIEIRVDQRTTVHFTMRAHQAPGSLHIAPSLAGATVYLDGELVGVGAQTVSALSPGEHIVEAELQGYQTARQTVSVEAGRRTAVALPLELLPQEPGTIVIRASVRAQVFVNGQDFGMSPVVLEGAQPGTYAVRVVAPGHSEYGGTCQVVLGETCTIFATLEPEQVLLRAESPTRGAHLYVDGEFRGPLPFEGTFGVGPHRVEVRAQGYVTHAEQITLAPGATRELNVTLRATGAQSEADEAEERSAAVQERRLLMSHAASLTSARTMTLDLGVGFPFLMEARIGGHIHEWLDIGFALRTFFLLTEIEARVKTAYRVIPTLSFGGQLRLGGGFGPARNYREGTATIESPTNEFLLSLEALMTVHFASVGSATLVVAMDAHSDRSRAASRQGSVRLRIGGTAEIVVNNHWNVYGSFEGIAAGRSRRMMTNLLGAGIVDNDPRLSVRLGFTYKFGLPDWEDE